PFLAGVLPTSAIAYLTRSLNAAAGVMISASHNPFYDNGIKVFGPDGFKLSDEQEADIERIIKDQRQIATGSSRRETGRIHRINDARQRYCNFLKSTLPQNFSLSGMKMVLDCSNGATYSVAPQLFSDLDAEIEALFAQPDGKNINKNCGSLHPESLAARVTENAADLGLAFDGDGDRLIAIDEKGSRVSGDQILALCAKVLKQTGKLSNNCVVSTVMSNFGLGQALKNLNIRHIVTEVGDRCVARAMVDHGAAVGGEDSGHMIFLDRHTTGDGLLTALILIESMQIDSKPLSELKNIFTPSPQVLINVDVRSKPDIASIPEIVNTIQSVEDRLKGKGRVLVRYSGTQPKCRIMVEGPSEKETRAYCRQIADIVEEKIGN
ncbi:MAG: phosphoglucosamine mutase, partial [Desulfobacterales bacterium]